MRVIVLCEESGTVRDAFAKLGHDAWSCDYQDSRTKGNHYKGNALDIINDGWDLMIGHPPCTFISRAGARWLFGGGVINKDRLDKGIAGRDFFMQLLDAPINHIAIENPTPMKIFNLPKETQVIQPYQFGHSFSKRTLLWLKNLPPLIHTDIVNDYVPYLPSNTGGAKRGQKATFKNISQKESSKTFQGIADAMASQWAEYINQPHDHRTKR